MKLLVTGGAGFIGSNFINYWLNEYPDDYILNLDALTYAGNLNNLKKVESLFSSRYKFIKGDINNFELVYFLVKDFNIDVIVNFAAESHNSWSIINPTKFFTTNVMGVLNLLEVTRATKVSRFHHISSCEVYGDLPLESNEKFYENSALNPKSPYNASKASSDLAIKAYFQTYKIPITISHCANNYGYYQFPEKVIPSFVTNLIENKEIEVYSNSNYKREWIHVIDHCKAIGKILLNGRIGESYNIGSGVEKSIEELASIVLKELDKPSNMKKYIPDRPAHDRRYLLSTDKISNELNWKPEIDFNNGIVDTINWYKNNYSWWKPLKDSINLNESEWDNKKFSLIR
jgi:dTDP-glucose 4,6-dehydratase